MENAGNVTFLAGLLQGVAERGRALLGRRNPAPATVGVDALAADASALLRGRGEASGLALARSILDRYAAMDPADRRAWLSGIARDFGPDVVAVTAHARAFLDAPDPDRAAELSRVAEPPRQELLRRLNRAPGGTLALVRMREDALGAIADGAALDTFDLDFAHLFSSWFNRGFLMLRRIDWNTPAAILEKIIRYEAVHRIEGWDDLRRRLEPPDRRLYAFFHPALGDEPLIFVEVALTSGIPAEIAPLLAADREPLSAEAATTAVFYSISNAQRGLAGVSFGNFLIKQVVEDLRRELPRLKTFVTLSPAPGFAAWLNRELSLGDSTLIDDETRRSLALPEGTDPTKAGALAALAAHYFLEAKTRSGRPLDPVARFHLGNGARLERIDPMGDPSPKGLAQSHGLMVNYLYDLDRIEENHEAFAGRGEIAASSAVVRLAKTVAARERAAKARAGAAAD